jgi:DHA1 family bicyclomycin/chloramphenicol resistance-like MFS transporter
MIIAIIIPSFVEVDITLPGFPQMAKFFNSSVTNIQWTLVINFIGLCIFTLFYGPLSDIIGRKKVLLFGCFLFFIASIGCSLTNELDFLYIYRFLQGLGCGAIWVVGFTVASDAYEGDRVIQIFGILGATISASLTVAPMVGSFIVAEYGWRATYNFVSFLSFISLITAIFLPETNLSKKSFALRAVLSDYIMLATNGRYLAYALTPSLLVTALIVYVSTIPFLYLEQLHMSFHTFALYQGLIGGCLAIVGAYSGWIHQRIGASNCILLSVIISCMGCIFLLMTSHMFPNSAHLFALSMSVICIGTSIQFSMVYAKSLELFPKLRGISSSLITFFRLILFSICVLISSKYYTGKLYDTAEMISGIIVVGLALSLYVRYDLRNSN